jgi:pre-rRNA-processing protein IPI1
MHTQNLRTEETIQGNFVTSRNLSLTDLVSQLKHYNPTHQKDALLGLRELISLHPIVLNLKLGIIFDATIPLMLDLDSVVRDAARQLFEFLFPLLTEVNHRITQ